MNVIRNLARTSAIGSFLAGVLVISLPNGLHAVLFNDSPITHVTSAYSAQVDGLFAKRGEHIISTPNGVKYIKGDPNTATITVIK